MTYGRFDQPKTRTTIEGQAPPEQLRFSPDDKWIAADTNIGGRRQVTVRPFAPTGPVVNITPRGGSMPVWALRGSTIFYQRDQEIVAVRYSVPGGRFIVDGEDVVVQLPQPFILIGLAPDGKFLVGLITPGQQLDVRVVVNWFRELPR